MLLLFLIFLVIYLIPTYSKPEIINNIITKEESEYIINKTRDNMKNSKISQNKDTNFDIRKSETAWLDLEDPIVSKIVERCISKVDRPKINCEKMQVVRYKPGGFYKAHQDVIDHKNPRLYTFLIALNDGYEGGETNFVKLNKKYKLNACDTLFFNTLDNYELDTSLALHGGEPVTNGEKWICNLWVHKYPYNN